MAYPGLPSLEVIAKTMDDIIKKARASDAETTMDDIAQDIKDIPTDLEPQAYAMKLAFHVEQARLLVERVKRHSQLLSSLNSVLDLQRGVTGAGALPTHSHSDKLNPLNHLKRGHSPGSDVDDTQLSRAARKRKEKRRKTDDNQEGEETEAEQKEAEVGPSSAKTGKAKPDAKRGDEGNSGS